MTKATENNYWISSTAISITLNAMGNSEYIQASTIGGAVIMCYMKGISGLEFDAGHNYKRWTLATYPTVFTDKTPKLVYVAIPRTNAAKTSNAFLCFPSVEIDLYGKTYETVDGEEKETQVGSADYYYIDLGGRISGSTGGKREWTASIKTGLLSTDAATEAITGEWYEYSSTTGLVTFLKNITFKAGQKFVDFFTDNLKVYKDATIDGKATIGDGLTVVKNGASITGAVAVKGNLTVEGLTTLKDTIASDNFVTGAPTAGSGWQIDHDGNIEGESIKLRGFMEVPEIRFNRASIIVGTNIQSECGGIVESVTRLSDTTGIVTLHLEDDDIAGSVQEGDLCWGYWHDINTKTNNAGEDYDSHTGIINYQGFATVYFAVAEILNKNSTRFRYELRPETNADGKPKYPLHPYVGMHFGGRGNQKLNADGTPKYPSRQGFTISTPRYTAIYQLVGSWDWSEMAEYVVQVQGYLDGFEVVANEKPGTWHNNFGTIAGNIYYKGKIIEVSSAARNMYITQSSNGILQADEDPEVVSIVIRDALFEDKTKDFDIYVNDTKVYSKGSTTACVLTYNYSDLTEAINRYSVVAKGTREIRKYENGGYVYEDEEYEVEGSFVVRKEAPVTTQMEISIEGDNLLALGETKKVTMSLKTSTGLDITDTAWKWNIARGSYNEDGEWQQSESDKVWGARDKAKAFNQLSYVAEASIMLLWSPNPMYDDLDPDNTVQSTTFRITAFVGAETIEETIEL